MCLLLPFSHFGFSSSLDFAGPTGGETILLYPAIPLNGIAFAIRTARGGGLAVGVSGLRDGMSLPVSRKEPAENDDHDQIIHDLVRRRAANNDHDQFFGDENSR